MFGGALVTVWSAPNYCYRSGNRASVLTIDEAGGKEFKVFDAAPENERDRGMGIGGRRMVSRPIFWMEDDYRDVVS
jgi:serine/threonine-protein phosphatase 6 catalytic subunit